MYEASEGNKDAITHDREDESRTQDCLIVRLGKPEQDWRRIAASAARNKQEYYAAE